MNPSEGITFFGQSKTKLNIFTLTGCARFPSAELGQNYVTSVQNYVQTVELPRTASESAGGRNQGRLFLLVGVSKELLTKRPCCLDQVKLMSHDSHVSKLYVKSENIHELCLLCSAGHEGLPVVICRNGSRGQKYTEEESCVLGSESSAE